MQRLFFILFVFCFFIACKKAETVPPKVSLLSPVATDSFYVADSVPVYFTISDKNLQQYKIIISNYFTHSLYHSEQVAVDSSTVTVQKKIFIDIPSDTTLYINVLGIDKNGNTGGAGSMFILKK